MFVGGIGDSRLPVTCQSGDAYGAEEQESDSRRHGPGRNFFTGWFEPLKTGKTHSQGILGRARGNAFDATGAFDGANGYEFIDGEAGRARFGALRTIDAGFRVAPDAGRAEERGEC
jgi:hypothetical protein